jgi:rhodanese-related sulfurtransferase
VSAGPIPSIAPQQASEELANAGALLLDVRERAEFEDVRAPDALLLPMSELQARAAELPARPLLVICEAGSRSLAATNYLRMLGRDATNVAGGMIAWQRAGLPVRTGPPDAGEGDLPERG